MIKRYSNYKPSGFEWIGEIPEHWSLVSIKHLVSTKVTDGPHETPTFVDGGIPFLSVESVQDNKLDFNKKRGYITKELHEEYSKKCKPQRDDIFIVKSGSTTGKSTIVETDEEFNIWSPLCIVRSNQNKIIPRFTFSSIQSYYFRRFVELGWSFGTQPNIGMGVIENIRLVVPPLSEQLQIVQFLDEKTEILDKLISTKERKIDLLKQQRTSLINEVVTKGLDPNVKMKDSGVEWIGEIPEHWKFIKLGHYTRIIRGGSPRPSGDPKYFNGNFIPWITVGEVTNSIGKYITSTETMLTEEGMKQSRVIEPNTLLLSNSGATLGVPKITKIKGCINDGSVGFLDIKSELNQDYLYYFLTTQTELLREQQSGYGQPNLNIDIVSNIKLPLPPIDQQKIIIEFIDTRTKEIDELVSLEQRKIEVLKQYRQSLISEVVTGKIDVRTQLN